MSNFNPELIDYRLTQHEQQIEHIRKHNHDVNKSLLSINENLAIINKSLSDELEKAMEMEGKVAGLEKEIKSRVTVLEDDLRNRNTKSDLIKSLLVWGKFAFYFMVVTLAIYHLIDKSELNAIVNHFTH